MILEQQITSTNESLNISFKIPKNLIGKPFCVSIAIDDESFKEFTPQEFFTWIETAEQDETFTLQEFTAQWNKKRKEIQNILN